MKRVNIFHSLISCFSRSFSRNLKIYVYSGFDEKLRSAFEEITAIDINDVSPEQRETIWKTFDRTCDNCDNGSTQFDSLNEAQIHYLNEHNISKGYVKCCDMKLREESYVKEHIAYHNNPELYSYGLTDSRSHLFQFGSSVH